MAGDKSEKRARYVAVIYLVLGSLLATVAVIAQPGIYSGSLHGQFSIEGINDISWVQLRAETKPAWYWRCPHNHLYQQITMICDNLGTDNGRRTIQLDMDEGTWSSDGKRGNLDAKSLASFFPSQDVNVSDSKLSEQVQGLLASLQQMHNGTFLPARHHPHFTEKPIKASYQHFTSGQNYGIFAVFAWLLVWPTYLIFVRQPPCPRWLTPRKALLVTSGIVVVLDLIFIGIKAVFSPGGVSEAMELLMAFLNAPSWIVLGDRAAISHVGLLFSAVSWSAIISAGTTFVTSPLRRGECADSV